MSTLGQWLAQATEQLRASASCDSPELEAQLLACHSLEFTRTRVIAFPEHGLDPAAIRALDALLQRRLKGEPIAYITGTREFWSIPLMVNSATLVPRADTEILVEKAIELASCAPAGYILDLGTGSGAIAIAVASELPAREVVAVEQNSQALQVALRNIRLQTSDNMHLLRGSWLDCIADNTAGMVLSNPPYLASNDSHLDTLQHEPAQALISGITGLEDIAHIIAQAVRAARPGAPLIIEHGHQQGAKVRQLLLQHQYTDIGTERDLAGHERISYGFVSKQLNE